MTAVLLLGPHTPLLFMGQEFNSSSPFAYFADYEGTVAEQLWSNRRKELEPFDLYRDPAAQAAVLNPCSAEEGERFDFELWNVGRMPRRIDSIRI